MTALAPVRHVVAAWLAIAVVFAAHEYGAARADGRAIAFAQVAYWSAVEWLAWAALTPLVFRLVAAANLDGARRPRALAGLALAGVAIALLQIVLQLAVEDWLARAPIGGVTSIKRWLSGYRAADPADLTYLVPRKLGFGYVVFWAVAAVGFLLRYHRLAVERAAASAALERELAEARLAAVRQQLHPHFLFNSLNGIAELVHEQPERAERMIVYLSDLLRRAIRADDAAPVPLARELGFVRRYVALQRARYGPRLRVRLDIPRDARACLVPPQILQPLVENAIQHGGPGAGHPGTIEIGARVRDGRLEIAIRDRGPGPVGVPTVEGTGLRSTRARLTAACADAYRLDLIGHPDGGAVCRIEIPCLT